MDFTLEPTDAAWVQESITKVMDELKQTTPNGRQFAETVSTILDREKNWIKWKNELCAPFDKEPWSAEVNGEKVGLWEATKAAREELQKPPEPWPWSLGSEPLTEVWEMGYRELYDLQRPFKCVSDFNFLPLQIADVCTSPGDIQAFLKRTKQLDARIAMRRKQLLQKAERLAEARAKQLAQRAAAQAVEEVQSEQKEDSSSATPAPAPAAPQPLSASGSAPLHPSLPPKPGTPVKTEASKPSVHTSDTVSTVSPQALPPTPSPAPEQLSDEQIKRMEQVRPFLYFISTTRYLNPFQFQDKQQLTWLALRVAREQHLQHFGRIGAGDIEQLVHAIEEEKKNERERTHKGEGGDVVAENRVEGESDVKMES